MVVVRLGERPRSETPAVRLPASRGILNFAVVAQLVERVLGKDEVTGSIPVNGSRIGKWLVCAAEDFDGAAVPWDGFRSPRTNQN